MAKIPGAAAFEIRYRCSFDVLALLRSICPGIFAVLYFEHSFTVNPDLTQLSAFITKSLRLMLQVCSPLDHPKIMPLQQRMQMSIFDIFVGGQVDLLKLLLMPRVKYPTNWGNAIHTKK
ncbi:MAG: hypothetical protein ABIX01_06685 [Chitinophagaceae bacterium]